MRLRERIVNRNDVWTHHGLLAVVRRVSEQAGHDGFMFWPPNRITEWRDNLRDRLMSNGRRVLSKSSAGRRKQSRS